MTSIEIGLLAVVALLAFNNGANDNFKGVATLFGSGTISYKKAVMWAMVSTFAGALVAFYIGDNLIKAFSGKGLVGADVLKDPAFLTAVAAAAAATVMLATKAGFPVSTTHAIIGGLVGAGLAAPGGVALIKLGSKFALPLLLAPFLGLVLTYFLYQIFHRVRKRMGVIRQTCLCIGEVEHVVATEGPALALANEHGGAPILRDALGSIEIRPQLEIHIDSTARCTQRYDGAVIGMSAEKILNFLHFLTAGSVGFARGLQDTAKIVGLLVGASIVSTGNQPSLLWAIALVAIAMALGGLLNARRVAETLSHKISDMNDGQGFTGNLVTSFLVIGSALYGWGVSTTHCSVGALFGIGAANGTARWTMIRQIILAWLITLPIAAIFSSLLYLTLTQI